MDIATVIFFSILYEVGMHYFPWEAVNHGEKLHQAVNYVIGTVGMIGPALVWLVSRNQIIEALTIVGAVVGSGLAVILAYALDGYIKSRETSRMNAQLETIVRHDSNERPARN